MSACCVSCIAYDNPFIRARFPNHLKSVSALLGVGAIGLAGGRGVGLEIAVGVGGGWVADVRGDRVGGGCGNPAAAARDAAE